ncbi:MAG: hypothetical protein JNN12_06030 [Bacteroidetes Order II. Incertae sedis bacterium]|nr:hypothetical protein [Bacteroidetes Order II. bacterium]
MKHVFFLLIVCIPLGLSAQQSVVHKGAWEVGGQIRYAKSHFLPSDNPASSASGSNVRVLNLYPDVQYFVWEGLGIGFSMAYGHVKDLQKPKESGSQSYAIGPKVAYYHKLTPALYPFVAARYKIERSQTGTYKQEGYGYGGSVGILWMTNKNVGLVLDAFSDRAFSPLSHDPGYRSSYKEQGLRFGFAILLR